MSASCSPVALDSRPYAGHGKLKVAPLCIVTTIWPFAGFASFGVSIKVFMPLLDSKFFVLLCQVLCFQKFLRLETNGFAQNDVSINLKYSLAAATPDVNVDWDVVVAAEEEPETVLGENRGHGLDSVFFANVQEQAIHYRGSECPLTKIIFKVDISLTTAERAVDCPASSCYCCVSVVTFGIRSEPR